MPGNSNLQLSIILPIYNVEPYLEKCIRSLENQDIPEKTYEIICVNDGSPDNSQQIVEKLQQEFSNITLINQKNQGVSVARNVGLKNSKGKYILFVDPDDSLETNNLRKLLIYTEKLKLEVVFSPFTFIEEGGSLRKTFYNTGLDEVMNGISLYYANRRNQQVDPDRSVAILYHRKFLLNNSLFYLQNVPYLEDGEFIARVLCLAKRGGIYNIPYYYRLNRPGSATRSDLNKQRRSINGFILAALNLKKFKESDDLNIDQKNFLNGPIIKFTLLTIQSTANIRGIKNYFWAKKQLIDNNLVNLDVAGKLNIYKKWAKIYNTSVNLFLLTYLKYQLTQKFLK